MQKSFNNFKQYLFKIALFLLLWNLLLINMYYTTYKVMEIMNFFCSVLLLLIGIPISFTKIIANLLEQIFHFLRNNFAMNVAKNVDEIRFDLRLAYGSLLERFLPSAKFQS